MLNAMRCSVKGFELNWQWDFNSFLLHLVHRVFFYHFSSRSPSRVFPRLRSVSCEVAVAVYIMRIIVENEMGDQCNGHPACGMHRSSAVFNGWMCANDARIKCFFAGSKTVICSVCNLGCRKYKQNDTECTMRQQRLVYVHPAWLHARQTCLLIMLFDDATQMKPFYLSTGGELKITSASQCHGMKVVEEFRPTSHFVFALHWA